jgi:Outer membrane protein beta-barrel domain
MTKMQKMFRRSAIFVSVMLVATVAARAQSAGGEQQNEVEVRGVYSIPSGDASFSTTTSSGTDISFGRDFDFRNELGFELRYTRRSTNDRHKFVVDYGHTDWSRSTVLNRSLAFNGRIYIANVNTTSDLNLSDFRAMYSYRWGNEKFRFGPMADAGFVKMSLDIKGTTTTGPVDSEASTTKFVATVGYDLDYRPTPKIVISHNLGAIAFSGEHFFHTEGDVKFFLARHYGVSGGYKAARYKLVDGDNFFNVRTHGPFFGGVLRF